MGRLDKLGGKKRGGEGRDRGRGVGGGVVLFSTRGIGGGGGEGGAGVGRRDISICARKLEIFKGDKPDDCSKKTSLYIICLVMFTILEGLMLGAVCNPVFK